MVWTHFKVPLPRVDRFHFLLLSHLSHLLNKFPLSITQRFSLHEEVALPCPFHKRTFKLESVLVLPIKWSSATRGEVNKKRRRRTKECKGSGRGDFKMRFISWCTCSNNQALRSSERLGWLQIKVHNYGSFPLPSSLTFSFQFYPWALSVLYKTISWN